MSKRHYVDAFEDTDAETIGLLGSRFLKVTSSTQYDGHARNRKASNDTEYHERTRKVAKARQRGWPSSDY
mgnify:CR=1 FL=1|jgi:hypothetical protein